MRRGTALVGAVALAGALAGCGGGSDWSSQGPSSDDPAMTSSQRCTLLDETTVGRLVGESVKGIEVDIAGSPDGTDGGVKDCIYAVVKPMSGQVGRGYEIDVHHFTLAGAAHALDDDRNTKEGTDQHSFASGLPGPSLGTTYTEQGVASEIEFLHGADVVTVKAERQADAVHSEAGAKALAVGVRTWMSK